VLVFGFAMFAGGIMRLPQLMDKIPPLCYLHHISFLRYVLEAFYVAEANEWADEISLMYVHGEGVDIFIASCDTTFCADQGNKLYRLFGGGVQLFARHVRH